MVTNKRANNLVDLDAEAKAWEERKDTRRRKMKQLHRKNRRVEDADFIMDKFYHNYMDGPY